MKWGAAYKGLRTVSSSQLVNDSILGTDCVNIKYCSGEYKNNTILLSSKSLLTVGGDRQETNTKILNIDKYNE